MFFYATFNGQVRHGWSRDPSLSGEVLVSGLSVGLHHFACSVGDHCLQGMRFTVTVEGRTGSQELAQTSMVRRNSGSSV